MLTLAHSAARRSTCVRTFIMNKPNESATSGGSKLKTRKGIILAGGSGHAP